MSLADSLRRSFEAAVPGDSGVRPAARRATSPTPRLVSATKIVPPPRPEELMAAPPEVADDSFDLLDRASRSMVFLLGRYRQLEEHVRQLDAWSKAQIQAAEAAASRWQDASIEAEHKVQELQLALDAAIGRVEAAEAAMQDDRAALAALQQRVIRTFGYGSEAHDALAALDIE